MFELSDDLIQMLDFAKESIQSEIANELDELERQFTPTTSIKQLVNIIKRFSIFLGSKRFSIHHKNPEELSTFFLFRTEDS